MILEGNVPLHHQPQIQGENPKKSHGETCEETGLLHNEFEGQPGRKQAVKVAQQCSCEFLSGDSVKNTMAQGLDPMQA